MNAVLALVCLLPASTLAVWTGKGWEEWWRSNDAPAQWAAPLPLLSATLRWRSVAPGVQWSETRLSGRGEAWRIRLIVARLDPRLVRFQLDTAYRSQGTRAAWTIDRAPEATLLAVNAGQFPRSFPWGWVVLNGREYQPPGVGPLSMAVAFDSSGGVRWLDTEALARQGTRWGVAAAFQSYPRLLVEGAVPPPLREEGLGVDLSHRDARAAFGQAADGSILIAMTRFDGAGEALDFVPFGLTVPEMAAVMGALGARNAVLLDGGISSQLLIADHPARRWPGLRAVPLGLVVTARN